MAKHQSDKIIGYLRTSTEDQLLGLDAQEERLEDIARRKICSIVHKYVEHESGGNNARPELDRAIRHARRIRAMLVVAKLDRLARDQQFLMRLVDGNVAIIFGDLEDIDATTPEGRMMLQVFATFAEFERRRISQRTKDALRVLKARGVLLGAANPKCRNLTPEARAKGTSSSARASRARAVEEQSDVAAIAAEKRAAGYSLGWIAGHLNDEGYPTRLGKSWTATQVLRVLRRIAN